MLDKAKDAIVGVDRIDGEVIVEFSDNTTAIYTADDLTELPNVRIKANLPILDKVE